MVASLLMGGASLLNDYPVFCVRLGEPEYPSLLCGIKEAPPVLYCRGDISLLGKSTTVAIVGSRAHTSYGAIQTKRIVAHLCSRGIITVSGFMYGIDTLCHEYTLQFGGRTVGVLPGGINRVVPSSNYELYEKVLKSGGLLISELDGDISPQKWSFAKRNRIIAGISRCVVVVEASRYSGSLITVNYANQFKRIVVAVPGNIDSEVSQGTNISIKRGSKILTSPYDLDEFLKLKQSSLFTKKFLPESNELTQEERLILENLTKQPADLEELCKSMTGEVSEIAGYLSKLALAGYVYKEGFIYYVIKN